ncbi:MAG: GNAT family protein [Bacteroidota bacterium]
MNISVKEMTLSHIESIVDYFLDADTQYLKGMGADKSKLPNRKDWIEKLISEYKKPYNKKEFYYIIWYKDNEAIGHSNVNKIHYGTSATMHLHLWKTDVRQKGLGLEFLKMTLPYYFKNLKLHTLYCEPYAKNIAPNKTLIKLGFELVQTYDTTPGWINFFQTVNRYELTKKKFEQLICGIQK